MTTPNEPNLEEIKNRPMVFNGNDVVVLLPFERDWLCAEVERLQVAFANENITAKSWHVGCEAAEQRVKELEQHCSRLAEVLTLFNNELVWESVCFCHVPERDEHDDRCMRTSEALSAYEKFRRKGVR